MTPLRRTVVSMSLLVAFVLAVVLAARAFGAGPAAADTPLAAGIRGKAAAGTPLGVAGHVAAGQGRAGHGVAWRGEATYWVAEFRRRWRRERRIVRHHSNVIRLLRRTLSVRAMRTNEVGGVWVALARCESGARWEYNGSSGFDGGLQFHPSTWAQYAPAGYPAWAWQASPAQQVAVARRVLVEQGWQAWPACARKLGLR